jgi:endonuclease YncB( thermonuclease family)
LVGLDPPLVSGPGNTAVLPEEAGQFVRNLLVKEYVYLDSDPNLAEKDAEGVSVAYLYRAPDKLPVNLELIRQGYALVAQGYQFQYAEEFAAYEQKAQADQKGIWATLLGSKP